MEASYWIFLILPLQVPLHLIPASIDGKEPVGHKDEFYGRHRTLIGKFGNVEHDTAGFEFLQLFMELHSPFQGIKSMNIAVPVILHALDFLRHDTTTAGDDQPIVIIAAFFAFHLALIRVNPNHLVQNEIYPLGNKLPFGFNAVCLSVDSKWNKQPAGLVVVDFFMVNDTDLPFGFATSKLSSLMKVLTKLRTIIT